MKKTILTFAAAAAGLAAVSAPAAAAPFQPLGQRLAQLEQRIDQGLRNGALSRSEADSLHVGVARIRLIEAQYRRGGVDFAERQDLDRRFENLARHVRTERSGRAYQGGRDYRDDRGYRGDRYSRGGGNGRYADRNPYR